MARNRPSSFCCAARIPPTPIVDPGQPRCADGLLQSIFTHIHTHTHTQVAAHACAAHETALAAELLASLPRRRPPGTGRRSPQPQPSAAWPPGGEASGNGVAVVCLSGGSGGGGGTFAFQRAFLEARAELLRLLGACWGMCQVCEGVCTYWSACFVLE